MSCLLNGLCLEDENVWECEVFLWKGRFILWLSFGCRMIGQAGSTKWKKAQDETRAMKQAFPCGKLGIIIHGIDKSYFAEEGFPLGSKECNLWRC